MMGGFSQVSANPRQCAASICLESIYGNQEYRGRRSRMEARQRRTPGPLAARGSAASWVRHCQADRASLRRDAEFSRHLALSSSASYGGAEVDRGQMGGESGTAPPPILPPDAGRTARTALEAAELEGFRNRYRAHHRSGACL